MITMTRDKVNALKRRITAPGTFFGTSLRKFTKGTDYGKWRDESNLLPEWDSRTRQIAALIKPGASVLEFGAGRMVLRDLLPEGCRYVPSDLVDRGNGTIVCDLNAKVLPEFPKYCDTAVFSGVLEYVHDVQRIISHISFVEIVVASYVVTDVRPNRVVRLASGWVNSYSSTEIKELFLKAGFRCNHVERFQCQEIFRFVRT
jgi:hypothetical protein